ncbi:MAG: hypothetical protein II969_10580 [Anaerolineaceae bacterium]|nr:hypothetical protein [Anaerolineaceae bacterium]
MSENTDVINNVEAPAEEIPVLYPRSRIQVGLLGTFLGFLMVVLGAKPEFFGMDRSPVIGFAQTATFLVGIGVIALSGYFCLMSFWPKGYTTITADFGIRLVATGWLIALFSGMADVFGFGSHPVTGLVFFGKLQALGVEIGEMVIGIGLVMMIMPPHSGLHLKPEDHIKKIDMTE